MTERFNNAVTKLYTAWHKDTLDAMHCRHCAVGNLCGTKQWARIGPIGSPLRINPEFDGAAGYSRKQLAEIESIFLYGVTDQDTTEPKFLNLISNEDVSGGLFTKKQQKELQFQGLCAVIEYLAELDGIPNPFNFSKLFNEDKEIALSELAILEA